MNYEITDVAYKELDRALCYFKSIEKEDEFFNDLMNQIRLIIRLPYAFQIKYRQVRAIALNRFNYSIHYTIYNDTIFILRIINQTQNF